MSDDQGEVTRLLEAISAGDPKAIDDLLPRVYDELRALARSRMAVVVKLRYFAGLTVEETAEVLGSSARSVNRDWAAARAWLQREFRKTS